MKISNILIDQTIRNTRTEYFIHYFFRIHAGDKDVASGGGKQFLAFEPVALVPFEPKLIDYSLLNQEHVKWLNYYNELIREKIGNELKEQKKGKR